MEGVEVLDKTVEIAPGSESRPLFSYGGDSSAQALLQYGEVK